MSLAKRQTTCPACGLPFGDEQRVNIETILEAGAPPHTIAVHWGESTFVYHRKELE